VVRHPHASDMRNGLVMLASRNSAPNNNKPKNDGVTCPNCSSVDCRRTVRHGRQDFFYRLLGMFPWRCKLCNNRFHLRKRFLG
jgi:hypothetical protein